DIGEILVANVDVDWLTFWLVFHVHLGRLIVGTRAKHDQGEDDQSRARSAHAAQEGGGMHHSLVVLRCRAHRSPRHGSKIVRLFRSCYPAGQISQLESTSP